MQNHAACIRIIDDDPAVRLFITRLIESSGYATRRYGSAEQFMSEDDASEPGCVLIDVDLPGLNGTDLVEWIGRRAYVIPTIVVTGNGTVPVAVQCLKLGAIDFLEKPINSAMLLDSVGRAVKLDAEQRTDNARLGDYQRDYLTLSDREKEVLALLSQGLISKQIARQLQLSVRTVEKHRINVMKKMHADTVADVVRAYIKLGLESGQQFP